ECEPTAAHRARLRYDSRASEFADQAIHRNATDDARHVRRRFGWEDDAADGWNARHGKRRSDDGRVAGGIAGIVKEEEEKEETTKVIISLSLLGEGRGEGLSGRRH